MCGPRAFRARSDWDELVDRLAERLRQRDDSALAPLLGRQVVEVRLHRRRQLVALLDALEPGVEERREGQVGVARRVGAPDLGPRRLLGAGLVERDPDQRGAVPARPGDVHGRLVPGHEPLVRVHPLREDRGDLAGVVELAGDERLADVAQVPLVVGVEERVPAVR